MLTRNTPYSVVKAYLKDKGITISEQSISRHYNNHVLENKKPKQIQKGNIRRKQLEAKTGHKVDGISKKRMKNAKDRINKRDADRTLLRENCIIKNSRPAAMGFRGDTINDKRRVALNTLADLEKDVDVISEMNELVKIAKDRVKRGLEEEQDASMILTTTGNAVKDYSKILSDFHEITAGAESVTQLRFSQLAQILGSVLNAPELSDRTRKELMNLMASASGETKPVDSNQTNNSAVPIGAVPIGTKGNDMIMDPGAENDIDDIDIIDDIDDSN